MKKYLLLIGLVMAGSRFSKLFNKGNVPDRSVEDVMLEKADKLAKNQAKKESFMDATHEIETSSGKNKNHKTMKDGMHEGQRAVGNFGFMPKTIKEMTKRMGDEAPAGLRPITEIKDEQEMADLVAQDPELEQAVADKLYNHVDKRFGGDVEKMNYSWEQGHNIAPDKITPDMIESHPRTEKFRKLFRKTSGTPE
jgi:hypothetical protein